MRLTVAIGLALLAGACMGGPSRDGPPLAVDDDGPPRVRAQLFISPSGQPFRATPGQPYPSAAWFAVADRDQDGRLTQAEFRADAEAWFKTLDANGDGQIDMPEATRWEEELVPEMSSVTIGGYGPPGAGGSRMSRGGGRNALNTRIQGAAAYSLVSEPHPVRGADANLDYRVTGKEWRAAADRRFAVLDKDGDGAVLARDLPTTPMQGRGGAQAPRVSPGARR